MKPGTTFCDVTAKTPPLPPQVRVAYKDSFQGFVLVRNFLLYIFNLIAFLWKMEHYATSFHEWVKYFTISVARGDWPKIC